MHKNVSELKPSSLYHLLIQAIIPRPIAWVLTSNGQALNLAPFSFFMAVSGEPPLLALSIGQKKDGSPKDTLANIQSNKFFVLHIPSRGMEEAVNKTADALPHGVSEIEHAGLEVVPLGDFPLPRLKDARIALGCELLRADVLMEGMDTTMVYGLIKEIYIDDSISEEINGHLNIDAKKMDPLFRLAGDDYGFLGGIKTVARNR